jgi:hypothetical protein
MLVLRINPQRGQHDQDGQTQDQLSLLQAFSVPRLSVMNHSKLLRAAVADPHPAADPRAAHRNGSLHHD